MHIVQYNFQFYITKNVKTQAFMVHTERYSKPETLGICAQNRAVSLRWAWAHVRLPLCSRSAEQTPWAHAPRIVPCLCDGLGQTCDCPSAHVPLSKHPGHMRPAVRLVFAMGVTHLRACSRSADAECVHHAQRRPQCHRQWRLLDAALTPSFKVFKVVFRPLSIVRIQYGRNFLRVYQK
jgi:hypothetical protein